MTPLQRRFKRIVDRFGEAFTSAGHSAKAIFTPVSSSVVNTFLTWTESDVADRPIRMAYVAFDDTTTESAMIAWNGLTLTVKRVVEVRFEATTVAKMLVLV